MRVKEILREKEMSAKLLAEKIGMTEVGLSIALSEKGNPSLKTLRKIADILEVDISELFAPKNSENFVALLNYNGELKQFSSIAELKQFLESIE